MHASLLLHVALQISTFKAYFHIWRLRIHIHNGKQINVNAICLKAAVRAHEMT
jgi:hypothetical protein